MKFINSLTGKKEAFLPHDSSDVRMYVCGPTVYDRAHIGNARSAVVFDQVFRNLQHVYGNQSVTYARNFTDIDDKIMLKAEASGESIELITDRTIGWYHSDMDSLGVLRPNHEPRATQSIPEMLDMIQILVQNRSAYVMGNHVIFDVTSKPDYGKLSRRNLTDMQNGVDHPELGDLKRHPGDFVLWKPSAENQPGWQSVWGRGRPGWHIECSAMSQKTLGGRIDIHGGGEDLKFPHHENEIAQSECSHPDHQHVKYWLHNSMVTVDGKKMSKSVGNVITVNQLLDAGVNGLAIRYMLLSTHYRRPLDFTQDRLLAAELELNKWSNVTANVDASTPDPALVAQLLNDVNVPGGMAVLRANYKHGDYGSLKAGMELLGLLGSI